MAMQLVRPRMFSDAMKQQLGWEDGGSDSSGKLNAFETPEEVQVQDVLVIGALSD